MLSTVLADAAIDPTVLILIFAGGGLAILAIVFTLLGKSQSDDDNGDD